MLQPTLGPHAVCCLHRPSYAPKPGTCVPLRSSSESPGHRKLIHSSRQNVKKRCCRPHRAIAWAAAQPPWNQDASGCGPVTSARAVTETHVTAHWRDFTCPPTKRSNQLTHDAFYKRCQEQRYARRADSAGVSKVTAKSCTLQRESPKLLRGWERVGTARQTPRPRHPLRPTQLSLRGRLLVTADAAATT